MALFGSEMTDVVTPDGRRITVPLGLAQQFPGLKPFQPPAPPPEEMPAPTLPPPPVEVAPAPMPTPAPVQAPVAPAGPAPTTPTAPKPRQLTDADLRRGGNAGVYNVQSAAIDEQRDAVQHAAKVEADAATEAGRALEARDARTQQILEERAKVAADHQAFMDGRMADYERSAKAIADVKIDRSADHPILGLLAMAIGGIGAAMEGHGGDNPAFKAFMAGIDRKVDGQMKDLEAKRGALATQRDSLGLMRQAGQDRLAAIDQLKLAAIDQAGQQLETIKTKSGSQRAIANATVVQAGLQAERGKVLENAMAREQTKKQHEDSIREAAAGRAQAAKQWQMSFDENKRQFDVKEKNDLDAAALAAAAKGNATKAKAIADASKDNEERGVSDTITGKRYLQPEGVALSKQADQHDKAAEQFRAKAQSEADPNKQQALLARADAESQVAADQRIEVATKHTWRTGSTEIAGKMASQVASTQAIRTIADEIKALREKNGPKWVFTSEGQAYMQAKSTSLMMAMKNAWQLGVLSAADIAILEKATGGDASKLTPGDVIDGFGVEGPGSRLDSLAETLEAGTLNEMRAKGFRGEFKIARTAEATRTPEEKSALESLVGDSGKRGSQTPVERAAGQGGGILREAVDRTFDAGDSIKAALSGGEYKTPAQRRATADIEGGSARYPGLSREQDPAIDMQLKAYAGKDETKSKNAATLLINLATDPKRPAMQQAMLTTLKANAPELYQRAIASLPAEDTSDKDATQPTISWKGINEREQAVMGAQPLGLLLQTSIAGDPAARKELAKRATEGDKDAARALQELIASKGRR